MKPSARLKKALAAVCDRRWRWGTRGKPALTGRRYSAERVFKHALKALYPLLGAANRCAGRLWRARLSEAQCISVTGHSSVTRPGRFLSTAERVQVEFSVRWPLLSFGRQGRVSVLELPSAGRCRLEQSDGWRVSRVRAELPARVAGRQGVVRLAIAEQRQGRSLGMLELQALGRSGTRRLLLEAVKARRLRLWIHSGARSHLGRLVPHSSDFLIPEFTIPGSEFSAFLPACQAPLRLSLLHDDRPRVLSERSLALAGPVLCVKGPAIPLQDASLFPGPGSYCLVASLAGREIARLPFCLVGEAELRRQVKVTRISLGAELRNGRQAQGAGALHWNEHHAIQPRIQIETDIAAPNTLVNCAVQILRDSAPFHREEFLVRLDRACQTVKLQRIELETIGLQFQPRPARLTITVSLDGEQKHARPVPILPAERLTNFEGQLNLEAKDLPLDEAEYERIVQRLGALNQAPPPPRRSFWRRQTGRRAAAPDSSSQL